MQKNGNALRYTSERLRLEFKGAAQLFSFHDKIKDIMGKKSHITPNAHIQTSREGAA